MDSKHFFRKQEDKIDPLALRPRDAAAALGISPSTLDRLTRAGKIPHVKINRLVLYRVESLRKWLEEREGVGRDNEGN
jgi:excisionase family DNA binding protein